jgi:hypothetical protein
MWYQDLHQFGAYFGLTQSIRLFPQKILYYCNDSSPDGNIVVTTHTRGFLLYSCLRLPKQMFVAADDAYLLSNRNVKLLTADPLTSSIIKIREEDILFHRSVESLITTSSSGLCRVLTPLEKYDASRFDDLLEWLHAHFELDQVDLYDNDIVFRGRLHNETYFGSKKAHHPLAPVIDDISRTLWTRFSTYRISTSDKQRRILRNKLRLADGACFDLVGGEEIPEVDTKGDI